MPYPKLQVLVSGNASAEAPALREEAEAALAEIARFRRVYSVFEECSPPSTPLPQFVKWCFEAWEQKCELEQSLEHIFDNRWRFHAYRDLDGGISLRGTHPVHRGCYGAGGKTFHEAILRLATVVAEATETKGE